MLGIRRARQLNEQGTQSIFRRATDAAKEQMAVWTLALLCFGRLLTCRVAAGDVERRPGVRR